MDARLIAEHAGASSSPPDARQGLDLRRLGSGGARRGEWQEIVGPDNYFLELMDHGRHQRQVVTVCVRTRALIPPAPPMTATT